MSLSFYAPSSSRQLCHLALCGTSLIPEITPFESRHDTITASTFFYCFLPRIVCVDRLDLHYDAPRQWPVTSFFLTVFNRYPGRILFQLHALFFTVRLCSMTS